MKKGVHIYSVDRRNDVKFLVTIPIDVNGIIIELWVGDRVKNIDKIVELNSYLLSLTDDGINITLIRTSK